MSSSAARLASFSSGSSANSTSSSAAGSPSTKASSVGTNMSIRRASPIIVESTSSTEVGFSATRCWAASIADAEGREVAGAEDLLRLRQRRQRDLDRGGDAERALRADQEMGEVDRLVAGHQRVEIVAADPALHLREARARPRPPRADRAPASRRRVRAAAHCAAFWSSAGKAAGGAVGEDRVDGDDVVAHRAVAQRARAAGIVAGHAADRRARGGGDVDREPQAVRLQQPVEVVEDDARLDQRAAARRRRARAAG